MRHHGRLGSGLILVLLVSWCGPLPTTAGAEGPGRAHGRYYEPVEVPGEVLVPLQGASLSKLAVYSFRKGSFSPLLFQIDELTPEGSFILTLGPEANPDEGNGILDRQDLVVFMARDASEKAPEGLAPEGADLAVAVQLKDPVTGGQTWVYVARFPTAPSLCALKPVSVLIDQGGVFNFRFPTYGYDAIINEQEKKPIPTIFINKLWVTPEAGGNGKNILDRQKIRGEISFLGGIIKVPINEKIVSGGVVAYKPGPVRILIHSTMYPLLPLKIKGPRFYIDSVMVDTLTLTTTIVDVPFDPGSLITEMTLSFGTDLSPEAKGMRYYNSTHLQGFPIDGEMDESERKFNEAKDEWRLVTGAQGTQIQFTRFDPKFLTDGKSYSTYSDNEKEERPPENYPGDIGYASDKIVVKSLPAGAYHIETFGCVPYAFYRPEGLNREFLQEILQIATSPLEIEVQGKKAPNQAGQSRVLVKK
ncbi:MAG: hypothetical protein A2V67_00390 [Deltaproteobacteria bacterium RBG_13_61_14]|nr:MAG: hypothetical protein A2V67_00390 [Deltaproteobacteria bacterium RBG_13_61_14]